MQISIFARVFAFVTILASLAMLAPAQAQQAGDQGQQAVIEGQLKAMAADDFATAYTFAAPVVKQRFPDPTSFSTMVKSGYSALIKPKGYSFGEAVTRNGQLFQELQLTDSKGQVWKAIYSLFKFEDGGWKITGVFLRRSELQSA